MANVLEVSKCLSSFGQSKQIYLGKNRGFCVIFMTNWNKSKWTAQRGASWAFLGNFKWHVMAIWWLLDGCWWLIDGFRVMLVNAQWWMVAKYVGIYYPNHIPRWYRTHQPRPLVATFLVAHNSVAPPLPPFLCNGGSKMLHVYCVTPKLAS